MRDVHQELTQFDGWGPFMAYQAVVDMRFTRLLSGAADIATWAAAGPGTIRGLNRLHGRPTDFALPQYRALDEIRAIFAVTEAETGVAIDFSDVLVEDIIRKMSSLRIGALVSTSRTPCAS